MSGLHKSQVETLRVVAAYASPYGPGTWDVLHALRKRDGAGAWSRHMVYRRLAELERSGHVDKDLLIGPAGFATASWTLTPTGKEALAAASVEPGGGKQ